MTLDTASRNSTIWYINAKLDIKGIDNFIYQKLSTFTDEQIELCEQVADSIPDRSKPDERREAFGLMIGEEWRDLRTIIHNRELITDREITIPKLGMLMSAIRYLEIVDEESYDYPHVNVHAKFSRSLDIERVPYHHRDDLVQLVHDYRDRHEEVYRLFSRECIREPELLKLHLDNASAALSDGIL